MEFWGVEVKAGQPLKVDPEEGMILHLSQASLGEVKKGNESVVLYLNVDGQKFVLGTLSHEKLPQLSFDLVFEKEFQLSHNWKNGSVYFVGYKSALPEDTDDFSDEFDSDEEEHAQIPIALENGKPEKKSEQAATTTKVAKAESSDAAKVNSGKEDDEDDDSDGDDESGDSEEDESDSDEEMQDGESSDESDEEDEDEETPKKVESGKKRPLEPVAKTPLSKKAKAEKTDGKKGGHVATPHPAKQAGKTPGNKAQPQTPKSSGQFPCGSCKKSFSSEVGLQSHTKAKHSGK